MTEPDLDALFDSERSYEEAPSPEVRLRSRDALLARLAVPDGNGGPSEQDHTPAAAKAGATIPLTRAVAGMIGALLVGAAIGAAAMRRANPEGDVKPIATAAVAIPSAPKEGAPPLTVDPVPSAIVSGTAVRDLPTTATAAAAPAPIASIGLEDARGIAAERALLDAARVALANGESAETLSLVDRHEREFRRGRLAEEREALAVRALVKAGRYDDARTRGARFKSAWPRSLAMPAVTGALESIP